MLNKFTGEFYLDGFEAGLGPDPVCSYRIRSKTGWIQSVLTGSGPKPDRIRHTAHPHNILFHKG
jgi:hypothetical protein